MGRQVRIYNRLTEQLAQAGAECVVVSSIAGHFCIDAFKARSSLPVVDLLAEVDQAVKLRGLERVGILGTRTVMETRFYAALSNAGHYAQGHALDQVHEAYVAMAAAGELPMISGPFFTRSVTGLFVLPKLTRSCWAGPILRWFTPRALGRSGR